MDTEELENFIQDTTEQEDPAVDDSGGAENELVVCACGTHFPACDDGVSALLKKCRSCYDSLRHDLEALESPGAAMQLDSVDGNAADDALMTPSDNAPLIPTATIEDRPNNEAINSDQIIGAMMMAVSDANKTFVLDLNGNRETFVYDSDPINASRARKLFKRTSWTKKDLYWYNVFGAMHSLKGPLITPCAVKLTTGTVILVAILETMCFRPRYDAIVYNASTKKASIEKYLLTKFNELDTDVAINFEEMDRYYHVVHFLLITNIIFHLARSKSY